VGQVEAFGLSFTPEERNQRGIINGSRRERIAKGAGRPISEVNKLLDQFRDAPRMRYILVPNQHIGAWRVGFMPQWITRDYLARRGHGRFDHDQISEAMDVVAGVVESAERVSALRAEKSKSLSQVNRDSVGALCEHLDKLKALLTTPEPDPGFVETIRREHLRLLAAQN
jgi:hypothetical protein